MKKILTVVGARPQFIKAATVSRALLSRGDISEAILHTGQHFDANMSDVFFSELDIPFPKHNLGIGGGTHGKNTGQMLVAIEQVLLGEAPDLLLVYGDTDSTLAGALAAAKLHVPVVHVEAGLRSFNRAMPEELNRVLTDHLSSLLFTPTATAVENLRREGIQGANVVSVGDVMLDAAKYYGAKASQCSRIIETMGLNSGDYVLATIHRQENTDNKDRLSAILHGLAASSSPVIWPMHPRAAKRISEFSLVLPPNVRKIEPVGYLDMVMLEKSARVIATDSGGVQKEAFFHRVPCVTLREETEWVELLACGANRLVGVDNELIAKALSGAFDSPDFYPTLFGEGNAASKIVDSICNWFALS